MNTALLLPALVLVGLLVAGLLVRGAVVTGRDVAWLVGPGATAQEADVARRYLARHRTHRVVGAVVGVLFGLVVGWRWYAGAGFTFGKGSPLADVVFCGLTGVVIGALSAETYRLRVPRNGRTTASLAPRSELPLRRTTVAARLVLGLAVVLSVVTGILWDAWVGLYACACGAAVVLLAEATRRAVAHRRRPVLSDRAQVLDRRFREFAASSVARLGLAVAVLVLLWAISGLPDEPGWAAVQVVAWFAGLGTVVLLAHRAAPRPPSRWTPDPSPATARATPAAG